jgi:hypothetical protein
VVERNPRGVESLDSELAVIQGCTIEEREAVVTLTGNSLTNTWLITEIDFTRPLTPSTSLRDERQ